MLKKCKTGEKNIEKRLRKAVMSLGGLCLKFLSPGFTGVPDRIILMPGARIWFVELKSEDEFLSRRQTVVIRILQRLGFRVWCIDREETLQSFLKQLEP